MWWPASSIDSGIDPGIGATGPQPKMTATRWIALFRGINVGGKNLLPMADLRAMASALGFTDVATYIQSGNLALTSAAAADMIETQLADAVAARFGFRPAILLRTVTQVEAALAANPFAARVTEGKQLHFYFLDAPADKFDPAALRDLAVDGEDFALIGDVLYLYARDGVGRSKLAEKLPRYLPLRHSARNLNSVQAILALAHAG